VADFGTPRTYREDALSSRSSHISSSSEGEYVTPRFGPNESSKQTIINYTNRLPQTNYVIQNTRNKDFEIPNRFCRPPLPQHKGLFDSNTSRNFESSSLGVEEVFSLARHSRFDDVKDLLSRGFSVNTKDENGNTLLSIACQNGNKRIAKLALRYGADINAINVCAVSLFICYNCLFICTDFPWILFFSKHRGNTALHFCYRQGTKRQLQTVHGIEVSLTFVCFYFLNYLRYGFGESLGAYLISKGADITILNQNEQIRHGGR